MNSHDLPSGMGETSHLLAEQHPVDENVKSNWLIFTLQLLMGGVGAGAGVLYFAPSQTCSVTPQCGEWLAKLASPTTAVIVFTSGGLDFSAGAMFMGAQSVQATINYIRRHETIMGKIGSGTVIVLVASSQSIPLLLAALNTSPALWQTILTVGGSLPASFFGAINLIETEIPFWMSKARVLSSSIHHRLVECCRLTTEAERQQWAMITHYRRQHAAFLDQLDAQWKYIVSHSQDIDISRATDLLPFLFQTRAAERDSSYLASAIHHAGTLSGFVLSSIFSSAFISNTFNTLKQYVPTLPLQITGTALFSLASTYANIKLTVDGFHLLLDSLVNVLRGKPIDSIAYQMRPKTTLLIGGLSLAAAALSYAVIAVIFISEFKDPNASNNTRLDGVREGMLYSAITGMDIYHFASLFHLYILLFSALTRNEKERFLFSLQKEVTRLKGMSESEFIQLVNQNSPERNHQLGIVPYHAIPDIENRIDAENEAIPSEDVSKPPSILSTGDQKPSCFSRWCCWFSSAGKEHSPPSPSIQDVPSEFAIRQSQ